MQDEVGRLHHRQRIRCSATVMDAEERSTPTPLNPGERSLIMGEGFLGRTPKQNSLRGGI